VGEASWFPSSPGRRPIPGSGQGWEALRAERPRSDSTILPAPELGQRMIGEAGETLSERASSRTVSEDTAAAAARSRPSATSPTCQ
jgi:hypothetical protein